MESPTFQTLQKTSLLVCHHGPLVLTPGTSNKTLYSYPLLSLLNLPLVLQTVMSFIPSHGKNYN